MFPVQGKLRLSQPQRAASLDKDTNWASVAFGTDVPHKNGEPNKQRGRKTDILLIKETDLQTAQMYRKLQPCLRILL